MVNMCFRGVAPQGCIICHSYWVRRVTRRQIHPTSLHVNGGFYRTRFWSSGYHRPDNFFLAISLLCISVLKNLIASEGIGQSFVLESSELWVNNNSEFPLMLRKKQCLQPGVLSLCLPLGPVGFEALVSWDRCGVGHIFGVIWFLKWMVVDKKWLLIWLLWLYMFKEKLLFGRKRIASQYLAYNLVSFCKTQIHILAASVAYFWVCVLLLSGS